MIVNEENIVQEIILRNEEAIAFILRQYGGLLNSIIRKYLQGSQQDIEECFADVITSIWYHIHSFDPDKNEFKHWMAAIAKYKAIDFVRKSAKERQLVSHLFINKPEESPQIEKLSMEDLLHELTVVERSIFEKYYVEGVPSKEIASQFNMKESWIHNKLSRGRKKLKSILSKGEVF